MIFFWFVPSSSFIFCTKKTKSKSSKDCDLINKNELKNELSLKDKTKNNAEELEKIINEIENNDENKSVNNHNEENDSSSEDILDNNHKINIVKNLKKKYYIGNVIGDGNCLFYSLSKLIFRNMFYYSHIRQLICDKIENTNIYDEFIEDKSEYVKKMRNDKEYGSLLEIETFCEIFKIKIIVYTRKIIDENYLKKDTDLLDTYIVGEKYKGNFGLIFDKYAKDETGI